MIPVFNPNYPDSRPISIKLMNARHYPAHIHTGEMEIIFCLSGEANVVTAQDNFKILENQIVTLDQSDVHCIYSDTDNILAVIHLDFNKSEKYSFDDLQYRFIACTTQSLSNYHKVLHNDIRIIILALIYDYCSGYRRSEKEYLALYEKLLDLLVNSFSWPYKTDLDAEANPEIKKRLHSINRYVQENYTEKITISQLSALGNINENYFSQFMKKTSYGGFREMLAYVRCYKAENMILNSNYSGEQISNLCGFSSTKYYYRWFKHFWGRSPMQHKKWYVNYSKEADEFTEFSQSEMLPVVEQFIADDLTSQVFDL